MSQSVNAQKTKQIAVLLVHPLVMSVIGVGAVGIVSAIFVNGFGH